LPLDYCQFLISAQENYTMTHFADHYDGESHDAVRRFLVGDKLTGRIVWEHVKDEIEECPNGFLVFDDSILDKNHSRNIELVRKQYSGNAHGLINGIGMINCVYVNPDTKQYWIVDYRIYDPTNDGKNKLTHVREMLISAVADKCLKFTGVLFDSWYTSKELLLLVESLKKYYCCPLKSNRKVDDSGGQHPYTSVNELNWNADELEYGKIIKIKEFPKNHKVKLFWVEVSENRTDWVVTNDLSQNSTQAVQEVCALRWKIEQFHREIKQVTGIEKCQACAARIQRNHIACAVLVWSFLKSVARKTRTTIYKVKMLSNYLRKELRSPSVRMRFT